MIEPFPFVSVSGTPYERGRSHGAAVPDRIAGSARFYSGQLDGLGSSPTLRRQLIDEARQGIAAFDEAYLEEMRGIADGSGVPLDAII
ncbi:MAG: acyl-CoA--6-aminopenicillanic acid acyltransferase, partial [Proteobacteria bacterium]|nr:acyl-CoA--6-aminopenicillanic acid acyltransferase [Pseudomonadota bacterium]